MKRASLLQMRHILKYIYTNILNAFKIHFCIIRSIRKGILSVLSPNPNISPIIQVNCELALIPQTFYLSYFFFSVTNNCFPLPLISFTLCSPVICRYYQDYL